MTSPSTRPFLPTSSSISPVSFDFRDALALTWRGLKHRNINAYAVPLVHRPFSEWPHDAVSEGVGYGMIAALYSNDQPTFNLIWDAAERYLWCDDHYSWRAHEDGRLAGRNPASDAEIDIATMLIFAHHLVENRIWAPHVSPRGGSYDYRAGVLLDTIYTRMVREPGILLPGFWRFKWIVNPGYFAPAFFRIFHTADPNPKHDWLAVVDESYRILAATPGAERGLVPDWCDLDGNLLAKGPGYNAFDRGHSMYKDGIRSLWRISTDWLWYREPRAKALLDNAFAFIESFGGAAAANFFDMEGHAVSSEELFHFDRERRTRSRFEHSHLTVGLWATVALAAGGPEAAEPYADELLRFYQGGDFWGLEYDPNGDEDVAHNEMYYDQFMAWFSAATLSGIWVNLTAEWSSPAGRSRLESFRIRRLFDRAESFRRRITRKLRSYYRAR